MNKFSKVTIFAAALAIPSILLTTGVSAAAASNPSGILDRVSEILNIKKDDLSSAFKKAQTEEIDKRLQSGDITEDQAEDMKEKIASSEGIAFMGKRGPRGNHKEYVAEFLGMTQEQMKASHEAGKTITDVLKEKGKTHEELANYVYTKQVDAVKAKVQSGALTQAQADEILKNLETRHTRVLEDIKAGKLPERGMGKMGGF